MTRFTRIHVVSFSVTTTIFLRFNVVQGEIIILKLRSFHSDLFSCLTDNFDISLTHLSASINDNFHRSVIFSSKFTDAFNYFIDYISAVNHLFVYFVHSFIHFFQFLETLLFLQKYSFKNLFLQFPFFTNRTDRYFQRNAEKFMKH